MQARGLIDTGAIIALLDADDRWHTRCREALRALRLPLATTLHFALSAEIVRQLAPKLQPRYLVLPAERFVMETPESVAITRGVLYPDYAVAEHHRGR